MELTQCERDIWLLMMGGTLIKNVACELGMSESMVKYHATHIYKKLDIANRSGLSLDFDLELTEDFAL